MLILCASTPFGPIPCFYGWGSPDDFVWPAVALNSLPEPFALDNVPSMLIEVPDNVGIYMMCNPLYWIFRYQIFRWVEAVRVANSGWLTP